MGGNLILKKKKILVFSNTYLVSVVVVSIEVVLYLVGKVIRHSGFMVVMMIMLCKKIKNVCM